MLTYKYQVCGYTCAYTRARHNRAGPRVSASYFYSGGGEGGGGGGREG